MERKTRTGFCIFSDPEGGECDRWTERYVYEPSNQIHQKNINTKIFRSGRPGMRNSKEYSLW